ncbi:hypothetical protein DIZ81_04665 [Legionella taurinensis]|uniref:Coiled-coil-containing protein n=1 Tax=Legionella taurinensis TaxID=70611 RepID=A0AB38N7V2_9GAMM|nr:hypothetical protein [Legionella taurinensis]MDX1836964.1 hypothetical protein [Legionella taurinensis]PUT41372.1 hypothetical protein DB744_04665 [Legionella taurinensis]PUT42611.1 hypothetical protein DB746_07000 [Legionella taurinensis]PUT46639.1 hypothetical protein DB743_04400 [Legionella taurinensis]PUT47288.1 hypothetical protein DB745_08080 [Legionella taurinensis]
MPKNILFSFLSYRKKRNKNSLEHAESINLKQTLDKKNYFLVALPPIDYCLNHNELSYTLLKHHVSVYENESQVIPQLSQLHYTADFTDLNGDEFRLHVYYDRKDQMVSGPHFSIRVGHNKYRELDVSLVSQELLTLAETSVHAVIVEIREKYLQTYNQLELEYQRLDIQCSLLYEEREGKRAEYLAKLKNFIKVTHNLALLTSHNHYAQKHLFLTRMLKTAEAVMPDAKTSLDAPMTTASNQTSSNPDKNKSSKPNANLVSVSSKAKRNTTVQKKLTQELGEIERQVDKLAKQFADLASESLAREGLEYTRRLADLWARCNQYSLEADFLLPSQAPISSSQCLSKLQQLTPSLEKACKEHFLYLLKTKQFAAAKLLQNFYYLLDMNRLCSALEDNNAELLDFILTHGDDLVLDNQVLILNKKKYTNAVSFCYESNSADCLAVLIKHDASLLIPDSRGLPLAYSLLTEPRHPLKDVLAACPEKTTSSSAFYFALKNALRHYLNTHTLSSEVTNKINAAIAYYQLQAHDLLFNRDLGLLGQQGNYSISAITLLMNESLPLDLLQDEATQRAYSQCIDRAMQFFKPLRTKVRMDMLKCFHGSLNDLSQLFRNNDVPDSDRSAKVIFLQQYLYDVEILWQDLDECTRGLRKASSLHAQQQIQINLTEAILNLCNRYNLTMSSSEDEDTSLDEEESPVNVNLMDVLFGATPSAKSMPGWMSFFNGGADKKEAASQQLNRPEGEKPDQDVSSKPLSHS